MELLHPHCAGLDIHKETVVACVRHLTSGNTSIHCIRCMCLNTIATEQLAVIFAASHAGFASSLPTMTYA